MAPTPNMAPIPNMARLYLRQPVGGEHPQRLGRRRGLFLVYGHLDTLGEDVDCLHRPVPRARSGLGHRGL
eukprot:54685-Prymnesium_polylepis.1